MRFLATLVGSEWLDYYRDGLCIDVLWVMCRTEETIITQVAISAYHSPCADSKHKSQKVIAFELEDVLMLLSFVLKLRM